MDKYIDEIETNNYIIGRRSLETYANFLFEMDFITFDLPR